VALAGGAERAYPSLPALLAMDRERFHTAFGETALNRTRRRGLLRNAALVLGNLLGGRVPARAALSPLERAEAQGALLGALGDPEALVRGAAAWALGQAPESTELSLALRTAAARETDPQAAHELAQTLSGRARVAPGRPPA
jgi:epoxyqueuosine reductase